MKLEQITEVKKDIGKKGATGIGALVGVLILVVLIGALGPTMFENLTISGAPSWVSTTLPIIVGAGLVMMLWRKFS